MRKPLAASVMALALCSVVAVAKSIRYSFRPKDLRLKTSYKWFGASGVVGKEDRIPNKGWISSKIG